MREDVKPRPPGHLISSAEFREDVRAGLSKPGQKELYSKYFYDDLGTALFEAITLLPEYGLTRADQRLLERHGPELVNRMPRLSVIAELGSGIGSKTKRLLQTIDPKNVLTYCPIDISRTALIKCEAELSRIPSIKTVPIEGSYLDGLRQAAALRSPGTSMVVLFLGSSIGNFDRDVAEDFCRDIRKAMRPGDILYLSTDLEKDFDRMIAAYNDALGVTAAFNLNLLSRINRELKGNFDLSKFAHAAIYNRAERRIEMHLRSSIGQTVTIGTDFVVPFRENETIWTESSHKFQCEDVILLAERSGFHCETQWVDAEWPFAQSVLRAA